MGQPGIQRFTKRHHARAAVGIEHIQIQRHARFKVSQLEQALHHHFWLKAPALRFEDDAQVLSRLIADIGEERQLFGLQHVGHTFYQAGFLHLIGNFGNDDLPGPALFLLDRPTGAHPEPAASGGIGLANAVGRLDEDAAGREIGTPDITRQRIHRSVRMLDQMQRRIGKFGDIVRRDRCRHADRDTLRAIRQQVRDTGGKKAGFLGLTVIGRAEIDRILVDAVEQKLRDLGHARFGVAHGGSIIAVDIAEITLPVDQPVAHREFLRQPDHRVIDRRIAMRVELTHDIADNASRFLETLTRVQPQLTHRKQQTAMHRLQAVTDIGKRTRGNGRQRIGEISLTQRRRKGGVDNPVVGAGHHVVAHQRIPLSLTRQSGGQGRHRE